VRWIGICDGNMQEGSFRCDANVSVRPAGETKLGTRCEIKNLNSFRFLQHAIEFEIRRQIELIEDGGAVEQETRLYDADRNETRSMRTKEDAQDYRYFPDPDLPPLVIDEQWIERVRSELPELPATKSARYQKDYGLSPYDATLLTHDAAIASYFEAAVDALASKLGRSRVDADVARMASTWVLGEVAAALNRAEIDASKSRVGPEQLAGLIARVHDGTISGKMAKEVFDALWAGEGDADAIIEKRGLKQISDADEIERIVDDVIAANAAIVAEYQAGKEKAFNSLVGKVMAATKGKANPTRVTAALRKKLG
jgi:aspartyl-tRNA(Asn)/glutamyl-tRNA(Gln) amidotransferase subunit B